jgi:uncharacterized protein (DUF488 family)
MPQLSATSSASDNTTLLTRERFYRTDEPACAVCSGRGADPVDGRRSLPIFTVGHSNRSLDALLGLLHEGEVELLADVRTRPGSQRLPHFSRPALEALLPGRGVGYVHLPELGGFRRPRPDSPNDGWQNRAFRGYADYMATPEWEAGLERLIGLAGERRTAVMCAEAVPWRCHRNLIADALVVRGLAVTHLLGPGQTQPHRLTPFAQIIDGRITYPAPDRLPLDG